MSKINYRTQITENLRHMSVDDLAVLAEAAFKAKERGSDFGDGADYMFAVLTGAYDPNDLLEMLE